MDSITRGVFGWPSTVGPQRSTPSFPDAGSDRPSGPRVRNAQCRYIVVEGPIGVGKTTLAHLLAERLEARVVLEVVEENPFLASFYADRDKHAFQTQLFFLLSRFKQQQSLFQQDLFRQATVSDYLFAKDRIFASLTLNPAELSLYDRVFEELTPRVMKPDVVVYLQASLDVLLARIKKRGREFEAHFDAEYLSNLCEAYNAYFSRYDETPLAVVHTDAVNFITEADEITHLLHALDAHEQGVLHYTARAQRRTA